MRLNQVPRENGEQRKIIEADQINIGPIVITSFNNGKSAGIWIGDGHKHDMIAIFSTPDQVGVGVYAQSDKAQGPCDVCLMTSHGAGAIQFSNASGETVVLDFDTVKQILASFGKG